MRRGLIMKLFYAIVLVLMVLVSACATVEQPPVVTTPTVEPEVQPEAEAPETGAAVGVPVEEEKAPEAATGNEVKILGVGQYDPEEVTINAGGSITFFNEGKLKSVIAIKGTSGIINTPVVKPGDKYEQEFAQAGEYDVWAVAYGMGVKVTVK